VSYFKKHKEGLLLTVLFHVALVLMLMKLGFFTPLPLPEDKGILVDFGTSNVGMGQQEPAPKPQQQEIIQPASIPPPPVSASKPSQNEGKEEVMTQNFEKTVAIDEGKKKLEEENKKKLEEEARIKRAAEEQKRRDNEARLKIEQERLAEQRRLQEVRRQDSLRKAQEAERIGSINQRAQNVFGGGGAGQTNSESSGQGVTYTPGNQGSESGTPGANQYGAGGGEGITFNLSGRSAETLPKPTYPGQEEGIVVVQVTVDQKGMVTKAEPGVRGSTSLDSGLLNAAKRAAQATRFNPDKNAPAYQTGTITYRFVLN
jgi:colicin import membrane protein